MGCRSVVAGARLTQDTTARRKTPLFFILFLSLRLLILGFVTPLRFQCFTPRLRTLLEGGGGSPVSSALPGRCSDLAPTAGSGFLSISFLVCSVRWR